MTLEPGTRVGPYEILAPLAAATGENYKASDTRDGRTVALRTLPPHVSQHPEVRERFEQEIQAIASLNHEHISAASEIVHAPPSADFLVTELLEDETLADRLAKGPLSIDDALRIAIAVAGALDKAHRHGIVHRGLTPSVVVLTAKGPKIVDFALAKPKEEMPTGLSGSIATRTSVAPLAGVPLPAASYMAPERFDGAVADARADVFALGAMLHEMVTGRKAFDGRTPALVVAAVQSIDPDPVSATQPMAPPALDHVLGRCLAKDPRQRLQTAWDLLGQLQWIAEGGSQVGIPAPIAAHRQKRERIVWAVLAGAALVAAAMAVPAAVRLFSASPEPAVARYLVTGVGQQPTVPITISPDGRWIAGSKGGTPSRGVDAMLRNSVATQVLISDEVVFQPFWSADSRSIGFFESGRLKKADVAGGPAQTICETPVPVGYGTWNRDGVILFSGGAVIQRVLAAGGQPSAITTLDTSRQETEHLAPEFLPDGRRYVFLALSSREGESAIYAGSLDSTDRTRLFTSDSRVLYASGHLLFNRGSAVFAQPFDAGTLALKGEAIRVADGVGLLATGGSVSPSANRFANFAASETGVLIYRSAAGAIGGATGTDEQRTLVWIDRRGARGGQVGPLGPYAGIDLSRDGSRFAVHRHDGTGGDSWVFDLAQGRPQRLTFDASQDNANPIWSPDGTRIAFASRRNNKWGLYVKPADGTGTEELLTESEATKMPMSWSPDGKLLVYGVVGRAADVWAVPVAGEKKLFPILDSSFNELYPQVSPDGKWLAYQSNETGRGEIYVRPFPDGPGKWQVSIDGGSFPRWRGDSKEIYFISAPNMMAAEIRVAGSSIQAGVPRAIFGISNPNLGAAHPFYHRFAVSADGQRFLMSQLGSASSIAGGTLAETIADLADRGGAGPMSTAPQTITVVVNWPQTLRKN